jgi:SOS response regulatory protein OraA/RecX
MLNKLNSRQKSKHKLKTKIKFKPKPNPKQAKMLENFCYKKNLRDDVSKVRTFWRSRGSRKTDKE